MLPFIVGEQQEEAHEEETVEVALSPRHSGQRRLLPALPGSVGGWRGYSSRWGEETEAAILQVLQRLLYVRSEPSAMDNGLQEFGAE